MIDATMTATAKARPSVRDYWQLTKPSITLLVVVTGLPAMIMAARGMPSLSSIVLTLGGTALASGAAAAMNMYIDRDIDVIMERTRKRPLPAEKIEPKQALYFGLVLSVLATLVLAIGVNLLTAALAVASILFYVGFYTGYLKRATPQNIVIGGAAGAVAPLMGWAGVTGEIGLPAWLLFLVIFLWTPPHFWALALYRADDYAEAGVPMMPVVYGPEATRIQMVLYSLLMLPTTLVLYPLGEAGLLYLASAAVLGILFLVLAVRLWLKPDPKASMKLFGFSILYLLLLFIILTVDVAWRYA